MKITEVEWNNAVLVFNDFKSDAWTADHCNKDRTLFYNKAILRKLTGKEVFSVFPDALSSIRVIPKDKTSRENSEKFIKRMYRFFSDKDFLSRHNLEPAFKCIVPIMDHESIHESMMDHREDDVEDLIVEEDSMIEGYVSGLNSDGTNLRSYVKTYVTRPRFLFGDDLVISLCHTEVGYIPTVILFTSSSAEEVTSIYNECNSIINEYLDTVTKKSGYYYNINIASIRYSQLNFNSCKIELKNPIIPKEIYNEGLPEEEITKFIRSDTGGLSIFYGDPGCGKSTFIKYLAEKFPEKKFNIISQDILLGYISEVRNYFLSVDKGSGSSIYIIEDCEKLLISRETKENVSTSTLSELLNMSDGILGDYLNIKFILTFNTKIPNIDKAPLRKGRLKVKYEFTPLKGKRLERLAEKLGIKLTDENIRCGMSLADIFNYNDVVNFSDQVSNSKIGFRN